MTTLTIESLGITKEELAERVVDRVATAMLESTVADEDGEPTGIPSRFSAVLESRIQQRVERAIDEIAGRHVLPNVSAYVEKLSLQETNKWGEARGQKISFIEYLVSRAENYLTEEVDHQGRSKRESDVYSWRKSTTRISYLVHQHLQYSIEIAMKKALENANSHIVGGIEKAIKIKLDEVAAQLQISVKTK